MILNHAKALGGAGSMPGEVRRDAPLTPEYLAEDQGFILVSTAITFAVLTTVVIALRFYARRFSAAGLKIWADDILIVAAYIFNLAMCALSIVMVRIGGVGRHVQAVDDETLVTWAKLILAIEIVYFTSVALPKMAGVCLYLRVFNWKGLMRFIALALLVVLASTGLTLVIVTCLQCRPLAYWWDRTIPGGSCFDLTTFFHAQSLPGFALDIVVMVLPLRTIWNLKLPTAKRIALLLVFLVASFGVVATAIRSIFFFSTAAFDDKTWASVTLVGWSIAEASAYIIAACLPHLRPLVSHFSPAWLKAIWRRNVSRAGSTIPQYHTRSRGDDDLTNELNFSERDLRRKWRPPGIMTSSSAQTDDWGSECKVHSPWSTRTIELRNSDEALETQAASTEEGKIRVTTEVLLERT